MVAEAGADVVELGMPFSDPVADGPVIQRANQQALDAGMSIEKTLAMVQSGSSDIPIVLFGYVNPILAYGLARFVEDAAAAGAAGLLVTDLPAGADAEMEQTLDAPSLPLIRLIAPTTDDARCARILQGARGFVYVIARLGVTGARTVVGDDLTEIVARVRRATPLPLAVGFGLRDAAQAAAVAQVADGVVVGSALLERLAVSIPDAHAFLAELRAALDGVSPSRRGAA